ncbi:MAG: hypothetical protein ACO3WM_11615, partial [Gemmobacter sp.]
MAEARHRGVYGQSRGPSSTAAAGRKRQPQAGDHLGRGLVGRAPALGVRIAAGADTDYGAEGTTRIAHEVMRFRALGLSPAWDTPPGTPSVPPAAAGSVRKSAVPARTSSHRVFHATQVSSHD